MTADYNIPIIGQTDADPFEEASTFTTNTSTFVQGQINNVNLVATSTLAQAQSAIDSLSNLSSTIATLPDYNVSPPILDPKVTVDFDVPPIDPIFWGKPDDFDVDNTVDTSGLPNIGTVTVPGFSPTPFVIDIPDIPAAALITEPGLPPEAPTLVFPDKITITLPDQPDLAPIVIPAFTSPVIDDFDPTFPTFNTRDISTTIDWIEPTYTEEVLDEVRTQIAAFFAGGSGIDADVEDSIFARGRDREDRTVNQQINQATEEWATRGYTAPPGMLVKRIDNIREEGTIKKLGLNREAVIKVHDAELENLRFAVQQGIAAEQLYVQMFLAKVERLFEVQKLSIEWQIQLYNIAVQVYSVQMEEVKIRTTVYEAQIRAAMIEVEVFKALIEGEMAKAEINKVLIEAYKAEIEARESMVRMYGEQVKAVAVEASVFATQVDGYKGEVDAYAARIGADKLRYDAYAAKIQGEGTKADILAAEARAYQSEVQGIETGVRAEVAALEGEVSAIEVQIRNYEAKIRGLVGRAQSQVQAIEANIAGNTANTQRFVAKTGAEEASSKVELAAWEGTNRTNLEIFKADIVAFQATLERAVKEIELLASTQTSAGQLASTISAGAMAAMHVGASISGSGNVGATGSSNYSSQLAQSVSCNTTNSSSITYEANAPTSHDCPSLDTGVNYNAIPNPE